MPDTYTPVLGLAMPEVGASRDSWGAKWNNNATILDGFVSRAMPIGAILDFAGPTAPSGWLICDGRLISRATYSALFAVIGTYWGAGDGSTTFALPNCTGRAGIGPGTMTDQGFNTFNFPFTQQTGFVLNTITQAVLPNYGLSANYAGEHSHGGLVTSAGDHAHTTDEAPPHSHGGLTMMNNTTHTHDGTTDMQGWHNHTLPGTWEGTGAGNRNTSFGGAFGDVSTPPTTVDGGHAHNVTISTENQVHYHGIYPDGWHTHNTTSNGGHNHGIAQDGGHQHIVSLDGGGSPFQVLSPIIVVTKIIFAGDQASLTAFGALVDVSAEADTTAQLTALREEVAELKRLFAPPGAQKLLRAPSRGPH